MNSSLLHNKTMTSRPVLPNLMKQCALVTPLSQVMGSVTGIFAPLNSPSERLSDS